MAANASNETLPVTYNPYDYPCNDGLLLPITSEFTWPTWVRAALYLTALLWSFLAVAIVADIFMCAIERITSKTRIVRIPDSEVPEGFRELKLKVSRGKGAAFTVWIHREDQALLAILSLHPLTPYSMIIRCGTTPLPTCL